MSFLRSVASGERPVIGRRVAVYGGGNTAMDAARVARRLGADEALIVYRRTREQMPAHLEEAEDAEREGVRINWLRTITAFDGPELQVELMELDESGFPQPTGQFETLAADTVILALGQESDTAFLREVPGVEFERDGTVRVSTSLQTGCPGVFAGGDMVPSERTVTVGVGHGKKAARHIDAWLRGAAAMHPPKHELASFDKLHLWYFGDNARRRAARAPAGGADRGLRRGGRRPVRRGGGLRGGPVPVVRQLLRVRRLPGRLPEGRRDQARARATGTGSTTTAAPAAVPASSSARCTRSRWSRRATEVRTTIDGNEAAASVAYRLNEVCCIYPITPVVADGRAGRRVVEPGAAERLGHGARGGRDAERGRRGRARCTARCRAARWRRRSPRRRACC